MSTPVRLHDDTVEVRPHEPGDVEPLFLAIRESIAEISPWLPWCHPGFSRAEFGIFDAKTGQALGGISLNHFARPNRLANMGYWVRTSATRRGVATRAIRLVAAFGFSEFQLTRIEIAALPDNLPSRRAAERAGACFETIARNRLVMHGRARDAALYSLIPADLAAT